MPFDVDLTEEKDSSLELEPTPHPSESDESSEPASVEEVDESGEIVRICKRCMVAKSGESSFCKECGDRLVPIRSTGDSYAGQVVGGRYKLVDKLGSGGMGEVYLGLNESLGQRVAVKFLAEKYAANEQVIMRFLNEARSYCKVSHPNAVTLLDYGQHDDGSLYLITEYIEGLSLREAVGEHGALSPAKALSVTEQCCEVLVAAHEQGVIHRDLKPDNIMLMPMQRGEYAVKVLDFGIAKIVDDERETLTKTGSVFGTPEFMSPEQAKGETADPRSDVYAMGIILYYSATGELPFDGESQFEVLEQQIKDEPRPPSEVVDFDVPEAIESVALRCLRKKRDERFESAEDLLDAIDEAKRRIDPDASAGGDGSDESGPGKGTHRTIELTSVAEETGNDGDTRGYPAGSGDVDARASTASARPTGAVPRSTSDSGSKRTSESKPTRTVGAFDDERPNAPTALPLRRSRSSDVPWLGVGAAVLLTAGIVGWNVWGGGGSESPAETAAMEETEEDETAGGEGDGQPNVEQSVERAKEALESGDLAKAESSLSAARRRAQKLDDERADGLVRSVATRLERIEANQQALAEASEKGECGRARDIGDDLTELSPGRRDWVTTQVDQCSGAEASSGQAESEAPDGASGGGSSDGSASGSRPSAGAAEGEPESADDEKASTEDEAEESSSSAGTASAEGSDGSSDDEDAPAPAGTREGREVDGRTGAAEGRGGGSEPEGARSGDEDSGADSDSAPPADETAGESGAQEPSADSEEKQDDRDAKENDGDEPDAKENDGDEPVAEGIESGDGATESPEPESGEAPEGDIPEGMSLPPDEL